MDAFGYAAAAAAPVNGYNVANADNARRDGYSPYRDELAALQRRLRERYGRRKCFRVQDVEAIMRELRQPEFDHRVERRLVFAPKRPAVIDLTMIDEVIE